MTERIIDNELRLIPYYRNDEASLPWYQDLDVCRQVDNREKPYDVELLHRMYDYLTAHGDCYYIEYKGVLVGDVSLRENSEIAVVVCKEYQNQHIGRRCVLEMLKLAREKGMERVKANIYSFNGHLLGDFANMCEYCARNGLVKGLTIQERLQSVINSASIIRPMLPEPEDIEDPHGKEYAKFRTAAEQTNKALRTILTSMRKHYRVEEAPVRPQITRQYAYTV